MKTKLLLIILLSLFFSTKNANCQNNVAIAENATWIIYHNWYDGMSYHFEWIQYKTGGHITIDSTDYIKLYFIPVWQSSQGVFHQSGPSGLPYAFRNDMNKRAYIYSFSDSTEYLWYDFNLSVGDTLQPPGLYSYQYQYLMVGDTIFVTSIDSVNYNGVFYKRFNFNNNQTDFPHLIQNIGFDDDLILGNLSFNFEGHYELQFFCPDTNTTLCSFTVTGLQNTENEANDIIVYPNPTSGQINIDLSNHEFNPEKILIKEITGKLIRTIYSDNNEKNINIEIKLPDGIYLIELQGQEKSFVRLINVINQ